MLENHQVATTRRIETSILDFVTQHAGCTQEDIFGAVTGNMAIKKNMLSELVRDKAISTQGLGRRSNPFTYWPDDPDRIASGEETDQAMPLRILQDDGSMEGPREIDVNESRIALR